MVINKEMMYKFNFILRTITLLSFDLTLPLITILIYLNTNGFFGWDLYEIILFQGIFILFNSIDRMFFQKIDWMLTQSVRDGTFDRYLLIPVDTLAYLSFNNFGLEHVFNFLVGVSFIIYSSFNLNFTITFFKLGILLFYVLMGVMLIYSLAMFRFGLKIKYVDPGRIGEFFKVMKNFGQYPVDIYNKFISSFFRYIIPLALYSYYPTKIILEGYIEDIYLVFISTLIIFICARLFWVNILKYYESAGG